MIVCTPPPQIDQAERPAAGQPRMPGRDGGGGGGGRRQGGKKRERERERERDLQFLTVATDRQTEDPISILTQRQSPPERLRQSASKAEAGT